MHRQSRLLIALVLVVGSLQLQTGVASGAKAGGACKKLGSTQITSGKTFTCIKKGKKLIWNKGVLTPAPAPSVTPQPSPTPSPSSTVLPAPIEPITPSPTATVSENPTSAPTPTPIPTPTSFENLYEARKGISLAAWTKVSETIKANQSKAGAVEIYTGPNTKPYYENYLIPISLVSRAFPNKLEPNKTFILRYNFADLAWAEQIAKEKIESNEYSRLQSYENNQLISGNCSTPAANCRGARQQATRPELSFILHGVENSINPFDPSAKSRFTTGLLEAHEYFHSLQRMPIMNRDVQDWPHAWFREGSAEWVANAVVNYENFDAYKNFQKVNCSDCFTLTPEYIQEYLESAFANSLPAKFNQFYNYNMGSFVIEALVALKGQESIIEMYAQMGSKLTFNQAFKVIYGVEWSYAIPILAKTVHANINGL